METGLFSAEELSVARVEPEVSEVATLSGGKPRLRTMHRDQIEMRMMSLDDLLPADHPARAVWQMVCSLDLGRWLGEIKAVEGHVGRDATDPRLLVALWVLATLEGIGSAHEIARRCKLHLAYEWLCGKVTVGNRVLSDFRSAGAEKWDDLVTQIVASLMSEGLVTLQRVAQDGMRVRAHAGKSSFRRQPTLERCLKEAREQVAMLKRLAAEFPEELSRQEHAAQQRAARERNTRIESAIRHCGQLQKDREKRALKDQKKIKAARASTTDPEARVMMFANGGFAPGYNVQFSTDTASGVIVGVAVTNSGSDAEQLPPMLDQLQNRYGKKPEEGLVDGGFATKETVERATAAGCTVYAPLKDELKQIEQGQDPYAKKRGDSDALAAWRERMGTEAGKAIYRLRPQAAEWVNAICRNRGLWQMPVRGLLKCGTVAVIHAVTHNLMLALKLRAEAAMRTG